jgi:hypothetical protein
MVKKPRGASPFYIVLSATYELTETGFLPHITGHSWDKDIRSELLPERGWLPPVDAIHLVHDEDDSHLNEASFGWRNGTKIAADLSQCPGVFQYYHDH